MVTIGVSIAVGMRVGNLLGEGSPRRAKLCSDVALVANFAIGCIIAFILILARRRVALIFTADPDVVDLVAKVLPIVALYIAFDAVGPGALCNILRGCALLKVPLYVNVVAFYVVGIPSGLFMTFVMDLGLTGLWSGLLAGMLFMDVGLLLYLRSVDWEECAALAQTTASEDSASLDTPTSACDSAPGVEVEVQFQPMPTAEDKA